MHQGHSERPHGLLQCPPLQHLAVSQGLLFVSFDASHPRPCHRSLRQASLGFLQAPHASGAVCFMHSVGTAALLAWDAAIAQRALDLYKGIAKVGGALEGMKAKGEKLFGYTVA